MKNNNEKTRTSRLAYEEPCLQLLSWENDILATEYSTEVGGKFPTDGDNNWN